MYHARRLWGYILEVLFPPLCLTCRAYLAPRDSRENLLCQPCFGSVPVYETVSTGPRFTLAAVSSYENKAMRSLLHALKYNRFLAAEQPLSFFIGRYLAGAPGKLFPDNAVILPVPLPRKRLRQRGFNQSEVIARILARHTGLPVATRTLVRTRFTAPQTIQKNKRTRRENVRGSFAVADREAVAGKPVVLVDDVYTSGATMSEAAKILRRAGARNIMGFVVAKAS